MRQVPSFFNILLTEDILVYNEKQMLLMIYTVEITESDFLTFSYRLLNVPGIHKLQLFKMNLLVLKI